MVGITLSPEQIRAAPPEVRRWLEHELAVSLGLNPPALPITQPSSPHLAACTPQEAAQVLSARFVYQQRDDVWLQDYVCGEPHRDISSVAGARRP